MDTLCIFCKIIAREIPAKIIMENDDIIVIQDRAPKAPIHYLLIPKKHVQDLISLQSNEMGIPVELTKMAQKITQTLSGSQSFRLIINNGADSGQSVLHLHMHFLSGKKMHDF